MDSDFQQPSSLKKETRATDCRKWNQRSSLFLQNKPCIQNKSVSLTGMNTEIIQRQHVECEASRWRIATSKSPEKGGATTPGEEGAQSGAAAPPQNKAADLEVRCFREEMPGQMFIHRCFY